MLYVTSCRQSCDGMPCRLYSHCICEHQLSKLSVSLCLGGRHDRLSAVGYKQTRCINMYQYCQALQPSLAMPCLPSCLSQTNNQSTAAAACMWTCERCIHNLSTTTTHVYSTRVAGCKPAFAWCHDALCVYGLRKPLRS